MLAIIEHMEVVPKHLPRKSCGIKPGTRVRVILELVSFEHTFSRGEELIFLREMFDRDMGCDVWVFGTDESRSIEDSLPEGGIVDGRYMWHELVRHKHIYGMYGLERPSSWLSSFEMVDGSAI